jgi:hypothetical protein
MNRRHIAILEHDIEIKEEELARMREELEELLFPERDENEIRRWVMLARLWHADGYTGQNSTKPNQSWGHINDAVQRKHYIQESLDMPEPTWQARVRFFKALERYYARWVLDRKRKK